MLRFEMDFARIAALQNGLIASGLRGGLVQAGEIQAFRVMLEALAKSFNRRCILEDGRFATLVDALAQIGTPPRPRRGVALLHGLDLDSIAVLPDRVKRGQISPYAADPHSYLFRLDDGPPAQRAFPAMTSVGLYMDCYTEMRILWIGESNAYLRARAGLQRETRDFSDWSAIDPLFDDWLRLAGA